LISTDPAADARLSAIYQEIGNRISRARKKTKLSQHELAGRIGLQRTSVTNIEKGRQKIMVHTLVEIARHLNVSPEKLLPRDPSTSIGNDVASYLDSAVLGTLRLEEIRFIEKSAFKAKKLKTAS
jgi:transcriptional regulator with XRE-family HTH domain